MKATIKKTTMKTPMMKAKIMKGDTGGSKTMKVMIKKPTKKAY